MPTHAVVIPWWRKLHVVTTLSKDIDTQTCITCLLFLIILSIQPRANTISSLDDTETTTQTHTHTYYILYGTSTLYVLVCLLEHLCLVEVVHCTVVHRTVRDQYSELPLLMYAYTHTQHTVSTWVVHIHNTCNIYLVLRESQRQWGHTTYTLY